MSLEALSTFNRKRVASIAVLMVLLLVAALSMDWGGFFAAYTAIFFGDRLPEATVSSILGVMAAFASLSLFVLLGILFLFNLICIATTGGR